MKNEKLTRFADGKLEYLPHNIITAIIASLFAMMSLAVPDVLFGFLWEPLSFLNGYEELLKYTIIIIFAAILASLLLRSIKGKNLGFEIKNPLFILVFAIGIAVAFNVMVTIAKQIDKNLATSSAEVIKSLGFGKSHSRDIIAVAVVTIFAPIWEEIVYRGLAFRAIRDGIGNKFNHSIATTIAFIVSSYLFMSAHSGGGQDSQQIYIFILAVILGASYLYTGSLLTPILAHSLNNTYVIWTALRAMNLKVAGISPNILILSPIITIIIFQLVLGLHKLIEKPRLTN